MEASSTYRALFDCVDGIVETTEPRDAEQTSSSPNGELGYWPGSIYEKQVTLDQLKTLANSYASSLPGPTDSAKNTAIDGRISALRRSDESRPFSEDDIRWLTPRLNYRMYLTRLATSYKNYLEISFANCQEIDAYLEYHKLMYYRRQDKKKTLRLGGKREPIRLEEIYNLVCEYIDQLFEEPAVRQGQSFGKIIPYMSLVLNSTNWTDSEMKTALVKCAEYKKIHREALNIISPLVLVQSPDIQTMISQLKDQQSQKVHVDFS